MRALPRGAAALRVRYPGDAGVGASGLGGAGVRARSIIAALPARTGLTVRPFIALLLAATMLLAPAAPALAAASCPRTTELAMESKVMCQVCGVPLALANSLEADRERVFITKLVNRCESVSQIEAAMVAQYGPGILASPGSHGFAVAAWMVPVAAILVAALAVAAVVLSRRRTRDREEPAPVLTTAEAAQLDAALSAFNARD